MNESDIASKLESMLTPKRFEHSIGVQNTAIELANLYGGNVQKASLAGLLHDCAKDIKKPQMLQLCDNFDIVLDGISTTEVQLIHGPLGACVAQHEFGIADEEILDAIYFHTTAKEEMSMLTKIIYLADYIEPNRNFRGVKKLRTTALQNLDAALMMALDNTLAHVMKKGRLIHPRTIEARNYILLGTMEI